MVPQEVINYLYESSQTDPEDIIAEKMEEMVDENLVFLQFNCLKQIHSIQGIPTFIMTNDQTYPPLTTEGEPNQNDLKILSKMQRYHLFSRIR